MTALRIIRQRHKVWGPPAFARHAAVQQTHHPPNGYNCRCRTRPMTRRALAREGLALELDPDVKTDFIRV